ncbi:MAG: class I SAM-dependent DNA methyltransferase [Candidatus Thorarchaeota archaeon]
MGIGSSLKDYYDQRANSYEEMYKRQDIVWQREIAEIKRCLSTLFRGRDILEIACGTGYWTQFLSQHCRSITAIDISSSSLAIARSKHYACSVELKEHDAFQLAALKQQFTGAMAAFWFSHIARDRVDAFLAELHKVLLPNSPVFFVDSVFIPGLGGELVQIQGDSLNTYKKRQLPEEETFLILKNYYSADNLLRIFRNHNVPLKLANIFYGKRFWFFSYKGRNVYDRIHSPKVNP